MKRGEILTRAKAHIEVDRAATHGNAEDTFAAIAGAWNWWLEGRLTAPLTPHDIAMMMGLFKDARVRGNPRHADSYEDGCGYRAIAGEIGTVALAAKPVDDSEAMKPAVKPYDPEPKTCMTCKNNALSGFACLCTAKGRALTEGAWLHCQGRDWEAQK